MSLRGKFAMIVRLNEMFRKSFAAFVFDFGEGGETLQEVLRQEMKCFVTPEDGSKLGSVFEKYHAAGCTLQ